MAILVAARDLPQDAIPATKSRLDDHRRPPNTPDHLGNVFV